MATAAYRKSEDSSRLSGLLKAGLSARNIRNSQKRRPTASRYCQNRPRSRYSEPWCPNQNQSCPSLSLMPRDSPARLPTTDIPSAPRRQEKAAAHPGRRDPEDGELEVPGTCQGVGQPAGDVEPVKGSRLHSIVGEHASQE